MDIYIFSGMSLMRGSDDSDAPSALLTSPNSGKTSHAKNIPPPRPAAGRSPSWQVPMLRCHS